MGDDVHVHGNIMADSGEWCQEGRRGGIGRNGLENGDVRSKRAHCGNFRASGVGNRAKSGEGVRPAFTWEHNCKDEPDWRGWGSGTEREVQTARGATFRQPIAGAGRWSRGRLLGDRSGPSLLRIPGMFASYCWQLPQKVSGMQGPGPYSAHTRCGPMPGLQSQTGTQLQPICSAWMGPQEA